ncbi:MAG: hypothetical protein ACOZAQ_02175 [Pseudomonadota bacterium]
MKQEQLDKIRRALAMVPKDKRAKVLQLGAIKAELRRRKKAEAKGK